MEERKLKIQNGEDRNGGEVLVGESVLVFSILFYFILFDERTTMKGRPCPGVQTLEEICIFNQTVPPLLALTKRN